MDHLPSREQDVGFDLESGIGLIHGNEEGSPDPDLDEKLAKTIFAKLCDRFMSVDDGSVKSDVNTLNVNEGSPDNKVKLLVDSKAEGETVGNVTGKKMGKEKRKKASSVKKPPRPPRGFSLDASDQKLIKELAELAMIKRARIERMKALKQKKALKISSSSSHGSLFAMLFTIIFFLVILLQGRNSGATFQGSPQTAQTAKTGLIFIRDQSNPSAVSPNSKASALF